MLPSLAPRITVTVSGVDRMEALNAVRWLDCEVGLLYRPDPAGRLRYPDMDTLMLMAMQAPRLCLHLCGQEARMDLLEGRINHLVSRAQRIQVNGVLTVEAVERICARFPGKTIITQHTSVNVDLCNCVEAPNHALLVDASGGRGILPSDWQAAETTKPVGYAGGLGPETLAAELPRILRLVRPGGWIDMEGQLRTDDLFDGDRAKTAVDAFHSILTEWRQPVSPAA